MMTQNYLAYEADNINIRSGIGLVTSMGDTSTASPQTDKLIQAIQPPHAILPLDASGHLNFSSVTSPTIGRTGNQGIFISTSFLFLNSKQYLKVSKG